MFTYSTHTIANTDPDIWAAIQKEHQRQESHIELIASENYASPAVLEAAGTQLTNKYAEGYPGHRYCGGVLNTPACHDACNNRPALPRNKRNRWRYAHGALPPT